MHDVWLAFPTFVNILRLVIARRSCEFNELVSLVARNCNEGGVLFKISQLTETIVDDADTTLIIMASRIMYSIVQFNTIFVL